MTTKTGDVTLRNMQKIVEFVRKFPETEIEGMPNSGKGIAPTLTEIAVGIGKRAEDFGNVQPMVKKLVQEGFLVSAGKNATRGIGVPKKLPRKYYYKPEQDYE